MFKRAFQKPDGRPLYLYARSSIPDLHAPGPRATADRAHAHLRWHPLRGEWVVYAGHRQDRSFLPPPGYNPLEPNDDPARPTEVPVGRYDIAVFENLSPAFTQDPHGAPHTIVQTAPAKGVCEMVVFTQDPTASLAVLPIHHLELLIDVWADRYVELGARPDIQYVLAFENRGVEVGATLQHPHGQIYGYPFVPPVAAREHENEVVYHRENGRGLLQDLITAELSDARRILYDTDSAVAFVPVCARYAYEVWVAPKRPVGALPGLTETERKDIARALKVVLLKFDGLWSHPFPYVMILHQAPTDGAEHPQSHLHFEFYPPFRMPGRLKYLAGSELGAGVFTADTLPEEKASELQAVKVNVDE